MSLEGNAVAGQTLKGRINAIDILTISAYGIAVKHGFKGTEEEWLKSLEANPEIIKGFVNEYLEENPTTVDTTLSNEGEAADAKATGDAIKALQQTNENVVNTHVSNKENPHGVTAEQVGARPNTWMPTASEVGAAKSEHKHSADNIEGGTLRTDVLPVIPVEKGGTGTTDLSSFRYALFSEYGQTTYIATFGNEHNEGGFTTPEQLRNAMGALTEAQVNTVINNSLGVIENGTY
jgi:hypothetical protein